MAWKNLSYWLRGLIIGGIAGVILYSFFYISLLHCYSNPDAQMFACFGYRIVAEPAWSFVYDSLLGGAPNYPTDNPYFNPLVKIFSGIFYLIFFSIIGLIIGWIVGKLKSKRKK